ncbi:MAG: hypothetical protein JWS10_4046 [Cypionkella sp.]|uniref:CAP domain-containing protein n=1 Tax=Cypionkella sp. TaxID=2811411 RepID=UPI00260CFCF3|nr:CAP domain-containing protein [Cypionkella sp.]MDB5661431.1 hypothetical protein [Cypionkella sp.]
MALTAAEQYSLELINRARLDPAAEAARYGINLNAGLAAGTISTASKQVVAPNAQLENSAIGHSKWMLAEDVFSHTGSGGSTSGQRATAAHYTWSNVGENLAVRYTSGKMDTNSASPAQHQDLFLSAGHRSNMMKSVYQEIGIAQERGNFTLSGHTYDASMLTEVYGRPKAANVFLTGVTYNDTDKNSFYNIGEAAGGVSFSSQGKTTTSADSGGYALGLKAGGAVGVTGSVAGHAFSATVNLDAGNVKLDVVNSNLFLTSGSLTLGSGIDAATLLGLSDLRLTGNARANSLNGNNGSNVIAGGGGADTMHGSGGNDILTGSDGSDRMYGDRGNDRLYGGSGNDNIMGATGTDLLDGGSGADRLTGDASADSFVFRAGFGKDVVTDFTAGDGDKLLLDDTLWAGKSLSAAQVVSQFAHVVAGNVVFEFNHDTTLTLNGLTSTAKLAAAIDII